MLWLHLTVVRGVLLALAMAALLVGQSALGVWSQSVSARAACDADVIVVMGAAQYNGVPSPVFQRRLELALELYLTGCAPSILVTGGKREGDRISEGEAGARYLLARGVPRTALAIEAQSRSSFENLHYSLPLLEGKRVMVVTDDLHAYRSRYLARSLGLEAEVAPVKTSFDATYALREVAAVTAYRVGIR